MNIQREFERRIKSAKERKGRDSENRAEEALDWLFENGHIATWWLPNYDEDRREGTDKFVQLLDGQEKRLQVKSSRSGFDHAMKNYPYICCIIVQENENVEGLAWRILGVLNKN